MNAIAPAPLAVCMPQQVNTVSAVMPQLETTFTETPFLRFIPSVLPYNDGRFQYMLKYSKRPFREVTRTNSPEGVIFEAYDNHSFGASELDAFLLGAITYPRLAEIAMLLASTISSRPLRAAVIGPGFYLQSAAVFASLGFTVDVYERNHSCTTYLEKIAKKLPEELQSRISFNPVERLAIHVATWENPSPKDSLSLPMVDIVAGGFFILQSDNCYALQLFDVPEWDYLLTQKGKLFPTGFKYNRIDIFQLVDESPNKRRLVAKQLMS
jgi:hypothetical protein